MIENDSQYQDMQWSRTDLDKKADGGESSLQLNSIFYAIYDPINGNKP